MTIDEQETDLCLPCEEFALPVVSAGLLAMLGAGAIRQCVHMVVYVQADGGVHIGTAGLGQVVMYVTCHTVAI